VADLNNANSYFTPEEKSSCAVGLARFAWQWVFTGLALSEPGAQFCSFFRRHAACVTKRHSVAQYCLSEDFILMLPQGRETIKNKPAGGAL